jgi:serine/threonine protein phosphatase PrpC
MAQVTDQARDRRGSFPLSQEQLAYHSDAGPRKGNEDCCGYWLLREVSSALLVLADGMGGHASGEVASQMATQTLIQEYQDRRGFQEPETELREAIHRAHQWIIQTAAQDAGKQGMGTTIVAALLQPGELFVAHVGDSRALQFRPPYVRRLTRDHLHVIDVLGLHENKAKHHPQGHVLSQALGIHGSIEPDVNRFNLAAGDYVMLCSDGVSEFLSEVEMCDLLTRQPLPEAAAAMVELALRKGSTDNCSVVAALIP